MERGDICPRCTAGAGVNSDRCQRCEDYSAFKSGKYSVESLEGLSARGKLALVLSELAVLREAKEDKK